MWVQGIHVGLALLQALSSLCVWVIFTPAVVSSVRYKAQLPPVLLVNRFRSLGVD